MPIHDVFGVGDAKAPTGLELVGVRNDRTIGLVDNVPMLALPVPLFGNAAERFAGGYGVVAGAADFRFIDDDGLRFRGGLDDELNGFDRHNHFHSR